MAENKRKNFTSVTKAVAEQNANAATKAASAEETEAKKDAEKPVQDLEIMSETEPTQEPVLAPNPTPVEEPASDDDDHIKELMKIVNNKGKKQQEEPSEEEIEEEPSEEEIEEETEEATEEEETEEATEEEETAEDETEEETEGETSGGKPEKSSAFGGFLATLATCLLGVIAVALIILCVRGCNSSAGTAGTTGSTSGSTSASTSSSTWESTSDSTSSSTSESTSSSTSESTSSSTSESTSSSTSESTSSSTSESTDPEKPVEVFNLEDFKQQVVNLAIATGIEEGVAYKRVTVLVNTFGSEAIEKWVKENGSFEEAEFMATLLIHGIKELADQLAEANGIQYAMTQVDFFAELLRKSAEFEATHGADPEDLLDEYVKLAPHAGARPEEILDVAKEKLEGESLKAFSEWYTFRNKGFADATQYERCQAEAEDMLLSSTENIKFYELVREQVDGGFADINGNPTKEFLEAVRQYSRRLKAGYAA